MLDAASATGADGRQVGSGSGTGWPTKSATPTGAPVFRRPYRDLIDRVTSPALLPLTGQVPLLARFDDQVRTRPAPSTRCIDP